MPEADVRVSEVKAFKTRSGDAVERELPPDELFDKLQPFKELVAEDIEKPDA